MSRVLVTGAAGFVGRYVVAELASRGHRTTALVRAAGAPLGADVDYLRADLRRLDDTRIDQVVAHDAIVHLAAGTTGTSRERFDGTVLATKRLLAALADRRWAGRFVHVSTMAIYDFNGLRRGGTVDEETPLEPDLGRRGDYAWTKAWQERVVRDYAAGGGEIVVVRPGAIYGRERSFPHRLGHDLGRRVLLVVGAGFNLMPLSYVENVASLLATCVEHPAAAGQTFNAVDPDPPRQWRYLRHLWPTRRELIPVPIPLTLWSAVGATYDWLERRTHGAISAPYFFARYDTVPAYGAFRYATGKPDALLGWAPPIARDEALRRTLGR